MSTPHQEQFAALLKSAVGDGSLVRLTLGKHRGTDTTLRNVFVRPVQLKGGARLSFVWRHDTRDVTKNLPSEEALALLGKLIGGDFRDAHLFTTTQTAQLECDDGGKARLRIKQRVAPATAAPAHDRAKDRLLPADAPWLRDLGVTNERGAPREGMAGKFRQIQKFAELLSALTAEAGLPADRPWKIADMGCGKAYLTFAISALFGERAEVHGIEARPDLVELCNRVAKENRLASLTFSAGTITEFPADPLDVLIALHACDTATDDALAKGIAAGARLLVLSPCCHKELRPQLVAPPVLTDALSQGIFRERQAEFVTDALRAQLLEWAGYRTKVFEFVSTEHTAKNLMIAAIRSHPPHHERTAAGIRHLAAFYGIRHQRLADHLAFNLGPPAASFPSL